MSEKLVDITTRIDNMRQLDSVVMAMRGIAAARAQQSRALLGGIESYADIVSHAIGQAIGLVPESLPAPERGAETGRLVILFCAEHGFAGAFSDMVLDAAARDLDEAGVMLVGTRGIGIADERGTTAEWSAAMASQVGGVDAVAGRVAEALYARIARGDIGSVLVFHPYLDADRQVAVARASLLPLDLEGFRQAHPGNPPLTTIETGELIERLTAEYVYAQLCAAAMHAFAAENSARMEAMAAAGSNIEHKLEDLGRAANMVRQEEVTAEIIELAAGSRHARSRP